MNNGKQEAASLIDGKCSILVSRVPNLGLESQVNRLFLEVVLQAVLAVVAADATLFPAAVKAVDGFAGSAIDVELSTFQVAHRPHDSIHVIGEKVCRQSE